MASHRDDNGGPQPGPSSPSIQFSPSSPSSSSAQYSVTAPSAKASSALTNGLSRCVVSLPQDIPPFTTLKLPSDNTCQHSVSAPANILPYTPSPAEDKDGICLDSGSTLSSPSSTPTSSTDYSQVELPYPGEDAEYANFMYKSDEERRWEWQAKQTAPISLLKQLGCLSLEKEDSQHTTFCQQLTMVSVYGDWDKNLYTLWDNGGTSQALHLELRAPLYENLTKYETYLQVCHIKLSPGQPEWPLARKVLKYLPIGDLLTGPEYRPTLWCFVLGEDYGIWLLRDEGFGVPFCDKIEFDRDAPEESLRNYKGKRLDVVEPLEFFKTTDIVRAGDLAELLASDNGFQKAPASWVQFRGAWVCAV